MIRPDLHTAVDALIQRTRIKVYREDTQKHLWQTIPSLWEQLETSAMHTSGAGTGAFGSRPTISTGVVSLIIDISTAAAEGAVEHAGKSDRSVPANLLTIASKLMAGNDLDQLDWWNTALRKWAVKARAELKLNPTRPQYARGIACPDCGAKYAMSTNDEGEKVRTPAVAITWHGPDDENHHPDTDWKVRAVECKVCGQVWWRGPDLDVLVEQMLTANTTKETMTG